MNKNIYIKLDKLKRRGHTEQIIDVLRVLNYEETGLKSTDIMFCTRMNHKVVKGILRFLTEKLLITETDSLYHLTALGCHVLYHAEEFADYLIEPLPDKISTLLQMRKELLKFQEKRLDIAEKIRDKNKWKDMRCPSCNSPLEKMSQSGRYGCPNEACNVMHLKMDRLGNLHVSAVATVIGE